VAISLKVGGVALNSWIRRRIEAQPRGLLGQVGIALLCLAAATLLRIGLRVWAPTGIPYITYFPALVIAGILGGRGASIATLLASAVIGSYFLVEANGHSVLPTPGWAGVIAYMVSGGLIVWLCDLLGRSLRELGEAHRQERLLGLELQHRVKNTLAIVQALANQTLAATSGSGFKAAFTERLIALGDAHNVLSESAWREVRLSLLVRRALDPFVGQAQQRLRLEGEDLQVPADLVVDLALCLHELGANATKHGALSVPGGHVEVRWAREADGRVAFRWSEHGGPVVRAPTHRGFGSRLLERGVNRGRKAAVAIEYRPEGLRWNVEFEV